MASKSKLTDELIAEIAQDVATGVTLGAAAEIRGIPRNTAYSWLRRGELAKSGPYRRFREAITKARAKRLADLMQSAHLRAIQGNVQAALKILEIAEPEEWSSEQRIRLEHSGAIELRQDPPRWFMGELSEIELHAQHILAIREKLAREANGDPERFRQLCEADEELRQAVADLEQRVSNGPPLWQKVAKTGRQAAQEG